jgi:hypothetical protein
MFNHKQRHTHLLLSLLLDVSISTHVHIYVLSYVVCRPNSQPAVSYNLESHSPSVQQP